MTHDTSSGSSDDHTLIGPESNHDFGDRFKVIRWLGRGGMGDVYLAMDNNLHRRVAIKVIRPDLTEDQEIRQRIERECLLHAKVGPHPNIVTLFDKLERGGEIQLIMEFVEGHTLREYLDNHHQHNTEPPRSEAFRITMQMLEALARIHAEGIVHRDIKPANVMLTRDDDGEIRAKLMDFGIARLETGGSQFTNMMRTAASSSMGSPGTPLYMAPEQFDSDTFGPVSARTDVYAMGIVLYELIAGRVPFGGSLTEILRGHLNSAPPPIRPRSGYPVPAPLASVVHTALAKKPSDRFNSAASFRDTLVHLSEIESSSLSEMAALPELGSDHRQKAKDDDDDLISPRPVAGAQSISSISGKAVPLPKQRPAVFARVAVIAAGVLIVLGAIGLFQVLTGGDDTPDAPPQQPGTSVAEAASAPQVDTTPGAVDTPAATPAGVPATPAPAVNAAEVNAAPQPPLDGLAGTADLYRTANGTLTAPATPGAPDSIPSGIADPIGIAPVDTPGSTIAPQDQGLTVPPTTPIPAEGFTMGSDVVSLPDNGVVGTQQPVSTESALEIVDRGIGAGTAKPPNYVVQPGDSLSAISKKVNVDMYDLAVWNELEKPNDLTVGQELFLYKRPNLRPVNPQWASPKKKAAPQPVAPVVAPAPEPAPAPAPPAPVVEKEEKGFIGRIVDKLNRKQREKKDELRDERGQ